MFKYWVGLSPLHWTGLLNIVHCESKLLSIKVLDSLGDGSTETHVDIV